jgi:hypothetical protein
VATLSFPRTMTLDLLDGFTIRAVSFGGSCAMALQHGKWPSHWPSVRNHPFWVRSAKIQSEVAGK